MKRLTTEEFIQKAKEIHEDKYDYSLVVYKNMYTEIKIICSTHGEFYQLPVNHLSGSGCKYCGHTKISKKNKSNFAEFSKKAKKLYNNKYDYSKVLYIKNNISVTIICPEHGEFQQTPAVHLAGSSCPKCGKIKSSNVNRLSINDFILKAQIIHNNKYDYSKVVYKQIHKKITIICPIHGDFEQTPAHHLRGNGCNICGCKKAGQKNTLSQQQFEQKANIVHEYKYSYKYSKYINTRSKISITCPIHGKFIQLASTHLQGGGCPKCVPYFWTKNSWTSLCNTKKNSDPKIYIIRCFDNNENFIKIGITRNTVYKRFNDKILMPYSYEIIKEIKGSPDFVWDKEKEFHKKFKKYKYKPKLSFGGETECFNINLLNDNVFKQLIH